MYRIIANWLSQIQTKIENQVVVVVFDMSNWENLYFELANKRCINNNLWHLAMRISNLQEWSTYYLGIGSEQERENIIWQCRFAYNERFDILINHKQGKSYENCVWEKAFDDNKLTKPTQLVKVIYIIIMAYFSLSNACDGYYL